MRKIGFDFIVAGVLLTVGTAVFAYTKYDEWFKFPILRAYVNDQLKDPGSTIYRNEHLKKSGWLCGELNSKNSSGGYVGFKRYVAGSADDAYLEGHGYVGIDKSDKHEQIMEKLNMEIELLEMRNEQIRLGTPIDQRLSWTESQIDELIAKRAFDKKWKQICE